jgi:hypothetical protein
MAATRTLLVLVLGLSAAAMAVAQGSGGARWPASGNGYMGLNAARSDFKIPCGSIAFPCGGVAVGVSDDMAVYARYNTSGPSYGIGLRWDFSPRLSAVVGWDNYDYRPAGTERDVRATSLGLQWRY